MQQIKYFLALDVAQGPMRGAAPSPRREGTEPSAATRDAERPAFEDRLMEEVCDRENLERAWKRVRANKGSPNIRSNRYLYRARVAIIVVLILTAITGVLYVVDQVRY